MMAAPMVILYLLSIGVAWIFGKKKPREALRLLAMTPMRTFAFLRRPWSPSFSVVVGIGLGSATAARRTACSARGDIYSEALSIVESEYVEPLDARCTNAAPCGTEAVVYALHRRHAADARPALELFLSA